jgi:hypothetical protein
MYKIIRHMADYFFLTSVSISVRNMVMIVITTRRMILPVVGRKIAESPNTQVSVNMIVRI